jgi:hypothetical protein
MKRLLFLALISAFLSACGGGGGQAQAEFKTLPSNMSTAAGN